MGGLISISRGGEGRGPPSTPREGTLPQPHRGTLTPLVPLSLRAFKEEGERKTEACTCALAQVHASSFGTGGRGR